MPENRLKASIAIHPDQSVAFFIMCDEWRDQMIENVNPAADCLLVVI
ncbi:MAG: hypothetical protein AB2699_01020 [Candidatus Thiodiazotropha taylori]